MTESNYVKQFEKDYWNCSIGKAKVQLGEYDNGDQYNFNIDIYLEGLYENPDNRSFNPFKPVNINIKGRGIEELRLMRDMFKDISEYINENITEV